MMEVAEQRKQQALSAALRNQKNDNIFSTALPMEGRLTFLPARVTPEGKEWAVPGALAAAWNAFTAPRRAWEGKLENPVEEALNVAGMAMTGAMPFNAPAGSLGMNVWHGSPHKFDKFDASKIGTGEGAQAYGHGLYLAESKDVAGSYAVNLANRDMANQGRLNAHANAQRLVNLTGNPKYAADDLKFVLESQPDHPQKKLLTDTLQMLESGDYAKPLKTTGSLYKVDLPDEQIAKMLNWDKPLSEQANVKAAVEAIRKDFALPKMQDAEGAGFAYQHLSNAVGGQNNAAALLRQAGIPGIRYLDGGSRGIGEGTSNFVVFPGNEDMLKILERNGQPVVSEALVDALRKKK